MAYVWRHPSSPFWTAVFRNEQNVWTKKSTKNQNRTKALALAIEWERAAELGRQGVLTESISREVISGILERTTGEKLRQSTLREFSDEWLRGKVRSRQDGTSTRYSSSITRFRDFLGKKADLSIAAVTPHDCQKFYDYLAAEKLAPATLVVEMKTVISLFNYARRLGLISTNPATAVQLPDRIKQVKRMTFTEAQVQMLIDAAEPEWRTAILLGYYAGLRLGDAASLSWSDVHLLEQKLTVQVSKTGETLTIPMHPVLEEHFTRLAGDGTGAVCPTLAAVPVGGRSGLSKQFLAIMRKAGIGNEAVATGGQRKLSRRSFHALRATFNSTLHNAGVEQENRMKLTGHKSADVNDRYTHTELKVLRQAVDKLPNLNLPEENAK